MVIGPAPGRQGQPGGDAEAAAGARSGGEVAAEQRGPLAHAGDPVAGPGRAAAAPAVGDLDRQLPVLLVDRRPGTGRCRRGGPRW